MKKRQPLDPEKMTVLQLLQSLKSSNDFDRGDAAEELGARAIASVWRPICGMLEDSYWPNRCSAAEALGLLRSPQAIPYLRRALNTRNAVVKGYVSETLAELGDKDSRPAFERMKKSRSPRNRLNGAAALYILGDDMQLAEVIRHLTSPQYRDQCASSNLLSRIVRRDHLGWAIEGLEKAIRVEANRARISDFKRTLKELNQR